MTSPIAMQIGEIPDWVPDSVKSTAAVITVGEDIARCLLHDTRMESVWREVEKQARLIHEKDENDLAKRLAALDQPRRMQDWGMFHVCVPLPDQALAAFFCSIVVELAVPKKSLGRHQVLSIAEGWHAAAQYCRMAIHEPGRPGLDPELARCLSVASEYLDEHARYIEGSAKSDNPYILRRSSGKRNDDRIRRAVRAMATWTHAIFGNYLYGTLATVAAVALQQEVDQKTVINWCKGLPTNK